MKTLLSLLFLAFTYCGCCQKNPKLVVGIVVDQMRQDYLYRFSEKFGDDGFKKLIAEGFQFKNAHYNYVPTYTAPGHASIYTGTTPAYHGIISNTWYDKVNDKYTYCVSDGAVDAVGGSDRNGKMSPKNLKASTITDELRLTSNFRSKVVGISIKDRGSILPAGHNPTGAYWFDDKTGKFITSNYYMNELPTWVDEYNKRKTTSKYLKETWEPLLPIEAYQESTADDAPYERQFKGKTEAVFPYDLKELSKTNGIGIIRTTPYGNTLVADMALAAIDGEQLGQDQITDFLAISFSSTDYVGHAFGPNSVELQDTYLRLDKELKRLLSTLEEKFGDDYIVFLTSDHGVVEVPLLLEDRKMLGGYIYPKQSRPTVINALNEQYGEGVWIKSVSNYQYFLDHDLIRKRGIDLSEFRTFLKDFVLTFDEVANAYTADDLLRRSATAPIKKRFENGFNQKMSGDVAISLLPGYLAEEGFGKEGTTHGTGYSYDTHVPIIFYGKNIKHGTSVKPVAITDIAPTLSMLLNISLPSSSTGQPLEALFE